MKRTYCDRCGREAKELKHLYDQLLLNPYTNSLAPLIEVELCVPCWQAVLIDCTKARDFDQRIRFATQPEVK